MDSAKKAVESVTEGVKKVAIGGPKKEKKPKGGAPAGDASQRALELSPPPEFLQRRVELYDYSAALFFLSSLLFISLCPFFFSFVVRNALCVSPGLG